MLAKFPRATVYEDAEAMLKQAKNSPDINNYLAWIATSADNSTGVSPDNHFAARCAAAIMLKNNVKTSYKSIQDSSKEYINGAVSRRCLRRLRG